MTTAVLAARRCGSRFNVRRRGRLRLPTDGPSKRGLMLMGCGLALLPWLVVLWRTVPDRGPLPHWNLAWVGLDGFEALGLLSAGTLHLRGDPRQVLPLSATATILLIDGWLDVSTATSSTERLAAIAMLAAEVPLAAFCLHTAYTDLTGPSGMSWPERSSGSVRPANRR